MGFFSKLKFCQRCRKSGFSVEIGGDGYCDNCRAIVAEESARRAAEARRSIAEAEARKFKASQKCQKCNRNGLEVEIEKGFVCNSCREKYPRIGDNLRGAKVTYQKWYLWNFDFIRRCRRRFIAFDLETTGLRYYADRVIEIAAVIYEDFQPVAHFSTLVNPERLIPAAASQVNNIYNSDLIGAPYTYQAIAEFCDFIGAEALSGETPMVAHNADFDAKFLLDELQICGISANLFIQDTLYMSKWIAPNLPRHRLCDVAQHFGITQNDAHRAADDARVCGEIFLKMLQIREPRLEQKRAELLPLELEICQWLKNEAEADGLNTQLYTVRLGKTFCEIRCMAPVLRIKARGKRPYIIVPSFWDLPEGLETSATTKTEGEVNVRLHFSALSDLLPLRDNLVTHYRTVLDANVSRINESERAFQLASEAAAHEISL